MFDRSSKDLVGAGLIAALGAGIVTSFAVGQGQHPVMGLGITAIAALFGMLCHARGIV
ncbi:MAG: hypothetical protein ACKO1W_01500 [Microcystaceae cyanobacterium]